MATPSGVHTCVYCGVRYQFSRGAPQAISLAAAGPSSARRLLLVGGLVGGLGAAVAVYLLVSSAPEPAPAREFPGRNPMPGSAARAPAAARPPLTTRPANNPKVSVQAAPKEVEVPASGEFLLETVQTSSTKALWIYGYFHNTSPFTLGKTKITAVFYDKEGAEIGQGSGYTEDEVIGADARVPTVILVADAPAAHERLAFEVHARRPSYLPAEVEGLEVEANAPRLADFLGWKYDGKVHNRSGQPAKFVKVRVLAFDQDDKFAGHSFTFASTDALADGATARFDGSMLGSSKRDFKRFEFQVSGRPER